MATELTEHLNGLIARIHAADRQIDETRGRIHATCGTLAALFEHNEWDEELHLPDVDAQIAHLGEVVQHAVDESAAKVGAALVHGTELLAQHGATLQNLVTTWDSSMTQTHKACHLFELAIQDALHKAGVSFDELEARLAGVGQELTSATDALDKVYANWEDVTSGDFTSRLSEHFQIFVSQLRDEETQKVQTFLNDAQQQGGEGIQQLLTNGTDLLNDFSHAVSDAITHLQQHVGEEVARKLEEAVKTLIDTALKEIMQSIMEAIATSQIGAEITSAMSPVLPYMIAAKKVTDVILQAIRIWHDTIGQLTSIF